VTRRNNNGHAMGRSRRQQLFARRTVLIIISSRWSSRLATSLQIFLQKNPVWKNRRTKRRYRVRARARFWIDSGVITWSDKLGEWVSGLTGTPPEVSESSESFKVSQSERHSPSRTLSDEVSSGFGYIFEVIRERP
jgi:hypothetical protein